MNAASRIAILGWGSLIPHARKLCVRVPFVPEGPVLPVEFSRRSDGGRLTLVIDRRGDPVQTYFAMATCSSLEEAVESLRRREGKRVTTEQIGIATRAAVVRSRDPEAGQVVRDWTAARQFDATIWTDLEAEWPEFTIVRAVAYLQAGNDSDRTSARRYFEEAPHETDTPLRRHLAGWINGGPLPS